MNIFTLFLFRRMCQNPLISAPDAGTRHFWHTSLAKGIDIQKEIKTDKDMNKKKLIIGIVGVLVVAGADFDVAAASARAVATTGDSGWEGAAEFARAGADDIPFGVKVTSLALALMSTVESVAVAISMRAFRHGIFWG